MTVRNFACLLMSASCLSLCNPAFADPVRPRTQDALPAPGAKAYDDPFQIAVRADNRFLDPILAVEQVASDDPDGLEFAGYSNYPAFIDRGEILFFREGEDFRSSRPLAVVPLDKRLRGRLKARTQWT